MELFVNHTSLAFLTTDQFQKAKLPFMYLARAKSADKNIVDRRKRVRNPAMSRTIKETRAKLSVTGAADFSEEILRQHTSALVTAGPFIPVMLMATAGLSVFAGFGYQSIVWALVATAAYACLCFTAKRLERTDYGKANLSSYTTALLICHFTTGIAWTWFAAFDCAECGIAQVSVIQAVILLLAMACTAMITATLPGALLIIFSMPVAAFTAMTTNVTNPVELSMTLTLYAGLLFFTFVEKYFGKSTVQTLVHQSEKDALIADLAIAKSMSDEARNRAEEANLAKSRFLASMSHELRTPLNAILGFSEVMAHEVLGPIENPTYKEYAQDINTSGQHLLGLINEILDLSRVEAGRQTLSEECIKLADIAEDAIHLMTLKARAKDIKITCLSEPLLPLIWVDERSVRQISLNLLSNAIKFTPNGGNVVVKIGWTNGGGQYISVKDDGPGIPEDEIPVVLSAFGQGSIAIKNADQGTGLGLPIVQAMMELHGGVFELRSKLREGTEALAIFPRSRVTTATQKAAADKEMADVS
jgi:two-component system, cell cycle sensor histidine kinase PleC